MTIAATDIRAFAALDPERAFRRAGYTEPLRRTGHKLVGLCPFHAEQDGSFTITLDGDHAGAWHCFGCKAGGDVLSFYGQLRGVHDFSTTCEELGELLGVTSTATPTRTVPRRSAVTAPPAEPTPLPDDLTDHCHALLLGNARALDWLQTKKGLPQWIIGAVKLGTASRPAWGDRPRFTIPVPHVDGRAGYADLRGYGPGRDPKMLPWEKGRGRASLYPWPWVRECETLVWCEGELDALNLIGRGIAAVTATCGAGAALSASFVIPDLAGKRLFVIGDNDDAGRTLNAELPARLRAHGATEVHVIEWPSDAPAKWDVSDHFAHGGTLEALGL